MPTTLDRPAEPLPFIRSTSGDAEGPISYEDGKVVFDPQSMVAKRPYMFEFDGHLMFAIKQDDGSVDFYGIEIEDQRSE